MKHLVLGLFLLIGFHTFSQTAAWSFPVSGKVTKAGKKLSGAVVTLLKSGTQVNQIVTNVNGKFDFVLEPNADYIITVTKPGFITKRFSFNTQNVPPERAKQGFGGVDLSEIVIFEIPQGVDVNELNSILSQPIAKFAFQDVAQDFNYDEKYTQSIRGKLDKLGEAQKKAEEEEKKKADGDKAVNDMYNAAVSKGDKALSTNDYSTAKAAYNEAANLKPDEKSIKDKLKYLENTLAKDAADKAAAGKEKELNDKYTAIITKADKAFAAKDYSGAKSSYNDALGLKASEKYPKDKIAEIDKVLGDMAAKDAADKAKAAKEKELNDKYTAAIAKADGLLTVKDYNGAKTSYTDASGFKPAEKYPKDKLAEIDKALADLAAKAAAEKDKAGKEKELNDKYTAVITKADASLAAKDYTGAKTSYTEALGLKAAEKYPKDKLAEIDKALADIAAKAAAEKDKAAKEKELNDKYTAAITKADASLTAKDYNGAKSGYTEATGLKPTEKYPKDKLAEVEKILADIAAKAAAEKDKAAKEKELNDKYTAAITKADALLASKDYSGARSAYTEALGLKPAEKYPKDKLTEVEKILAEIAAKESADKSKAAKEKELNAKYDAAVAKADKAFTANDYTSAKAGYTEAAGIKPTEKYPQDKLAEIEKALADKADKASKAAAEKDKAAKEKEVNAKYDAAIAKADKAFTANDLTSAKTAYTDAASIKPAEKYPQDKLAEIDKLLADKATKVASDKDKAAKEKELNDKYNAAIAKADKGFTAKDYLGAKAAYNEAATLKLNEEYPKKRLTEIEKILAAEANKEASDKEKAAKEKEINEKYTLAMTRGNKALTTKDYDNAKTAYNEALTLKPFEQLPKDKLAEIQKLLLTADADKAAAAKEKETNDKYNAAIVTADKSFTAKDYDAAKSAYSEASGLKSAEKYPKDKLAEIEKIMSDIAAKENAKKEKVSAEKEVNDRYTAAISKADQAFAAKLYTQAQGLYSEASGIKPAEKYPKDQMMEIERLQDAETAKEAEKAKQGKYKGLIEKGDKQFSTKEYKAARLLYVEASGIKPVEKYPKEKIAEIDGLLGKLKAVIPAVIEPPKDNDPVKKQEYVNALVLKYPQGITEEQIQEGNCKILKRVVVKGNSAATFKKSTWGWGGVFYFKDDMSITEAAFNLETQ
jgi:hypothetical protein